MIRTVGIVVAVLAAQGVAKLAGALYLEHRTIAAISAEVDAFHERVTEQRRLNESLYGPRA